MSSRSRPGGLPTGPSPRSRSRPRQEEYSRPDRESPRPLRSQKSTPSFPRSPAPSRVAEPQRTPRSTSGARPNDYEGGHRRSDDSTSSLSSGASSLFDRMKSSAASYASSFTSVEDEEADKPSSLRDRRLARAESSSQDVPINVDSSGTGDGYTIWSRVASAASTLTVNVSKAWTTNIATFAGEETPPGQESRLTRAMKAYHLEKARDPTDLPAWLFDEHERRPLQRAQRPRRDVEEQPTVAITEQSRPRGLRYIYDSVARSDQPPPIGTSVARGGDRLKALREAKRNAAMDQHTPPRAEPIQQTQIRQRVGLPSGPSRRR